MENFSDKRRLEIFTSRWWDDFLETSCNLTKTSVFKGCMDRVETRRLRSDVLRVVKELASRRICRYGCYGYRVFIDGVLVPPREMERIYDVPPLDGEALEDWTERAFGDKKFGIIINLGENFDLDLASDIALKTKPLWEKVGFPREGTTFTIFIGNYDKTPLGIHKDSAGENVIHFHLGPAGKRMYTWGQREFESLLAANGGKSDDMGAFIPHATESDFGEGDLYFMPEGQYHIGQQEGLSIGITLWQHNHTTSGMLTKLRTVLFSQFSEEAGALLAPDRCSLDDVGGLDQVLDTLKFPEELASLSFKDLMREAYRDLRYSIHSNAGYSTHPSPMPESAFLDPEDVVQKEEPFEILWRESLHRQKLHVYARGVKLELNNFECIKELVRVINLGAPKRVQELLGILDASWDEEIGLYILSMLYRHHGIRRLQSSHAETVS